MPNGAKPQPQKVASITQIALPTMPKQLCSMIGMINYYKDFIPKRVHLLAPITSQTCNKKVIDWTPECKKVSQQVKSILAQEALLTFPHPK